MDEYITKISQVTKKDIVDVAQKIKISTVYFLTKEENANE